MTCKRLGACSATASPRACASRTPATATSRGSTASPLAATAAPRLALLNLGRRNLLAAEVRASQLAPALAFRPDLAIVAAGGNDALRRSFDPGAVERELVAIVGPLRRAGADVVLLELMDIVASGLVAARAGGGARRAHAPRSPS